MSDKDTLKIVTRDMPPPATAEVLIAQAIDKGVTVDTMERLLAMRRELKSEAAKEAFDRSMSAFQSECPVIDKSKKVLNKDGQSVRYAYAPLDAIVTQVKPLLQKHGFGYRIVADVQGKGKDGEVQATCVVTHELGHSETSSFKVPIDLESYMNLPQKFASALTFAKRYAFTNAFGLMTGETDDDGQRAGTSPGEENQKARWAKPAEPRPQTLHALKSRLWNLCKQAGAKKPEEAEAALQANKILKPGQKLASLTEAELHDAVCKLEIVIEEAKGPK